AEFVKQSTKTIQRAITWDNLTAKSISAATVLRRVPATQQPPSFPPVLITVEVLPPRILLQKATQCFAWVTDWEYHSVLNEAAKKPNKMASKDPQWPCYKSIHYSYSRRVISECFCLG
ncbi:MAG: hypothetical protein ACI9HY_004444, partial [Planctomycetaceae bacterium]